MPEADQGLYARGKYRLAYDRKRDGSLRSPFLQIVWYDGAAGRNRSRSTGTEDIQKAEDELDALYLKKERGQAVCATCGQMLRAGARHLVTGAIADYLVAREGRSSIGSIRPRLAHVTDYLTDTDRLGTACEDVDEDWIEGFREWAASVPIVGARGAERDRTPGTIEASVRQLAAVINFAHSRKDTLFPAGFAARDAGQVSRTPAYRADVKTLAAMFRYCVEPRIESGGEKPMPLKWHKANRAQLHRFLQISVATWARPDAAHDVSTARVRDQWQSNARALNLNPKGRAQTKKYRPIVPIGPRMAALLDAADGFYVSVKSVRQAFVAMQVVLGLPGDGESGMKLIRRSMAHLARQRARGARLGGRADHARPPPRHHLRYLCAVRHRLPGARAGGDGRDHRRDREAGAGSVRQAVREEGRRVRYLDVCAGISASTVAWKPLGWQAAAYSEIEPAPRAVLAHHYPDVPLHGDFTTIRGDEYGAIDLLVGGTPCQDFSVAGLRAGLDGDRGNLSLEFLRLADRSRPRWLVWENVPGVLSIDGGRAFGAILGGLGELGYGFAYRVLDAQHFGVPQRRRRVFVVGHLGDHRRAGAVLFERHSLSGHPAPRREPGEGTTACAAFGISSDCFDRSGEGASGSPGERSGLGIVEGASPALRAKRPNAVAYGGGNTSGPIPVAAALAAHGCRQDFEVETFITHALRGEGFDASEDGTGRGTPLVPVALRGHSDYGEGLPSLRAKGGDAAGGSEALVPIGYRTSGNCGAWETGDRVDALTTGTDRTSSLVHTSAVRRLTPRECERLQGFPDDYTLVPYRRGMMADGPRYKALGNSMAVPVMRWIGERIAAVQAVLADVPVPHRDNTGIRNVTLTQRSQKTVAHPKGFEPLASAFGGKGIEP